MKRFFLIFTAAALLIGIATGQSQSQTLALSDNFSSSLTANWIPGRATDQGSSHDLSIDDGELKWIQHYDYIESKNTFGNDLMIEFDYRGGTGSIQAGEFWIELVALTGTGHHAAGIYRSQYGIQNYHAVNVGKAPSPTDSTDKDTVSGPAYLSTMSPGSPRQGKITFTYLNQRVRMQFENQDQDIVQTSWVDTGNFTQTKIRIWGMGGPDGSARYIDNVNIYAPSGAVGPGPDPDPDNDGYTFVKIADTQSTFQLLDQEPTLNDCGTVAFWAEVSAGIDGTYTGTGESLTTILHVTEANI